MLGWRRGWSGKGTIRFTGRVLIKHLEIEFLELSEFLGKFLVFAGSFGISLEFVVRR